MEYKILGTNNIKIFINIMTKLHIGHIDAMVKGVSQETIEKINELAEQKKVMILALPMDLLNGQNRGRVFNFIPMDRDSDVPFGVFVPIAEDDDIEKYQNFIETMPIELSDVVQDFSGSNSGLQPRHIKRVGRPKRETSICKDDIGELGKLLDSNLDVNDFLKIIK